MTVACHCPPRTCSRDTCWPTSRIPRHYPAAARQGFFWWEIDLTWYGLRLLAALGLIHGLKPVPAAVREAAGGSTEDLR